MTDPFLTALQKIAADPTNAQEIAQEALNKTVYGDLNPKYYLSVFEYPKQLHYEVIRTSDPEVAKQRYAEIKERFKTDDPKKAGGGHGRLISMNGFGFGTERI